MACAHRQAAFNKIMTHGLGFVDGMRNPFRNTDAAQQGIMMSSRYYLRCRWAHELEAEM
jgi:hypothetical protein